MVAEPDNDKRSLRAAWTEGVAKGLIEHLPGAVGLMVRGFPVVVYATFTHFALGASMPLTAFSSLTGAGAYAAVSRRKRR
jgi:hypothetical protein